MAHIWFIFCPVGAPTSSRCLTIRHLPNRCVRILRWRFLGDLLAGGPGSAHVGLHHRLQLGGHLNSAASETKG